MQNNKEPQLNKLIDYFSEEDRETFAVTLMKVLALTLKLKHEKSEDTSEIVNNKNFNDLVDLLNNLDLSKLSDEEKTAIQDIKSLKK